MSARDKADATHECVDYVTRQIRLHQTKLAEERAIIATLEGVQFALESIENNWDGLAEREEVEASV